MQDIDLNLLTALDTLLAQGSVAGAARRLGLSASAMSRTLARLRMATGDPLLVRAGRGLVPTPHADALRARVHELAQEAAAVLRPATDNTDIRALTRTFTIRANDSFVEAFAARLIASACEQAPGVRLHFVPKPDKDVRALREGLIDLEVGVQTTIGPELRIQALFRDHYIGAVRAGHPLLSGEMTATRYAACGHVVASPQGQQVGAVDAALAAVGLTRRIVAVVPGFSAALAVAAASDLVALVTRACFATDPRRQARDASTGLRDFPLPVEIPSLTICQIWHPRMDNDPAHRWLRSLLRSACSGRENQIG